MNLMDLFIKVGVKDEASGPLKKLTGAVGGGLKVAAAAGVAAVGAAATAVGKLVTESVKAYGEYEQLVGGAKKIFDQMDYSVIANDAANAWSTMNLSASQYLSMMNNVGATFAATMGDEKGYETAKRGMQAIADYASGTGKNVGELNDKFSLITRSSQSYQSIADQFSGILPATSKDFLAQAQAAGYLSDSYKQLTEVPIAEYQEAVSLMLEKGVDDLNLTGNTAAETAHTITGSLAGMKAAWANLITGLGDPNADLNKLFDDLTENALNFANNVKPVIQRTLKSVGTVLKKLAPTLGKELPGLMAELLPDMISAATGLASSLAEALPDILSTILDNLPAIASAVIEIAVKIFESLAKAIPELMSRVWEAVDTAISNSSFGERWQSIKEAVAEAVEGIKEKWDGLKEAISGLLEKLQPLFDKIGEIWQKFKDWEEENHVLEGAIKLVGNAISGVIGFITDLINLGTGVWDTIAAAASGSAEEVNAAWSKVEETLGNIFGFLYGGNLGNALVGASTGSGYSGGVRAGKFGAIGNDFVPYNNYPMMLHRGEAVLTAREADAWRRGEGSGRQIVNNFSFNGVSQSDLDYIVGYVNRELVSG